MSIQDKLIVGKEGKKQKPAVNVVLAISRGLPEFYEDTNFVSGDSPVTIDCNTDLGVNAANIFIVNDGPGDFTVAISEDGLNFSSEMTVKINEKMEIEEGSIDTLRITWVADSAYRVWINRGLNED